MERIHLDHNATTPLRPEAREAWLEAQDAGLGNPSGLHAAGRRARAAIDDARERVAASLRVHEEEVFFTSGGTEANNQALRGCLQTLGPGARLVTAMTEHSSVLELAHALAEEGRALTLLEVDGEGRVQLDPLAELAGNAPDTPFLVSLAHANNEIGTLGPIEALVDLARSSDTHMVLHSDAVQALGRVAVAPNDAGLDMASFSAHKVGGPVGVGVLWRRRGVALAPLLRGGGQEGGQRAGTEDAAGIVAASVAIDLAVQEQESYAQRTQELTAYLWKEIERRLPNAERLGPALDASDRLPNTLAVLFPGQDGKVLVTRLDLDGLEVSAGSACASGSIEASHVVRALGYDEDAARAAVRLSLGRETSRETCAQAVDILERATS